MLSTAVAIALANAGYQSSFKLNIGIIKSQPRSAQSAMLRKLGGEEEKIK